MWYLERTTSGRAIGHGDISIVLKGRCWRAARCRSQHPCLFPSPNISSIKLTEKLVIGNIGVGIREGSVFIIKGNAFRGLEKTGCAPAWGKVFIIEQTPAFCEKIATLVQKALDTVQVGYYCRGIVRLGANGITSAHTVMTRNGRIIGSWHICIHKKLGLY